MSAIPSPSVSSVGKAGVDCSSRATGVPSGTWIWVWVTTTGTSIAPSSSFIKSTSTSYTLSLLWSCGLLKSGGLINAR